VKTALTNPALFWFIRYADSSTYLSPKFSRVVKESVWWKKT